MPLRWIVMLGLGMHMRRQQQQPMRRHDDHVQLQQQQHHEPLPEVFLLVQPFRFLRSTSHLRLFQLQLWLLLCRLFLQLSACLPLWRIDVLMLYSPWLHERCTRSETLRDYVWRDHHHLSCKPVIVNRLHRV